MQLLQIRRRGLLVGAFPGNRWACRSVAIVPSRLDAIESAFALSMQRKSGERQHHALGEVSQVKTIRFCVDKAFR